MSTPRVHVIALGGTIASTNSAAGTGVAPAVTGDELVAAVPQLASIASVTTEQLAQVGSASLTPDILCQVARAGLAAIDEGARGVVVTQGTDTLEESAYLLSLLNARERPFVVTGAMRNPTLPGADGAANLLAAVSAAAHDGCARVRCLVAFNDELHDPLWVHKSHVASLATFTSGPQAGPLGWVHEGDVRLGYHPEAGPLIAVPDASFPPIALIPATLGEDLRVLDSIAAAGYRGAVIDGVGGGHVHASAVERVAALAGEMPVVLASRTGSGHMLSQTYGYPGSEIDLLGRGLLSAGPLSGRKARLLLGLLIANDTVGAWPY